MRAFKSLHYGDLWQDLNEAPICPYCGKKMLLKDSSEVGSKYKGQERYICAGYPVCDSQARVQMVNGSYQLVSTPANKELRNLRREAHFWMDKLVETKTVDGKRSVAFFLSSKSMVSTGKWVHIGQCREEACKEIIALCINTLYDNRNNFEKFEGLDRTWAFNDYSLWRKVTSISYKPDKCCKTA